MSSQHRLFTMSLLAIVAVCALGWFGYALQKQNQTLNEMWMHFSDLEKQKTSALATINKGFGYGGFIHHYKNYILRKQPLYYQKASESLALTYHGIDDYLSYSITDENRQQMTLFRDTIQRYEEELQRAHQLVLAGESSQDIDKQVYIDDSQALNTLAELFSSIEASTLAAQSQAKQTAVSSRYLTYYGAITMVVLVSIIFFFVLKMSREITASYHEFKLLIDAAPNGIIEADNNGKILRFNKMAVDLFGYSEHEFSELSIEDLVPPYLRQQHQQDRKNFQDSDETRVMDNRRNDFSAIRKNGEIFPVALSIASLKNGSNHGSITIIRDMTVENELVAAANKDHLTQLANRHSAEKFFLDVIKRVHRYNDAVSVIMVDIDFFKTVNDSYGHAEGDKILKQVANLMSNNVRETDLVSRWGGEEFLIICPETTKQTALEVAEKLRSIIQDHFKDAKTNITISAGIAEFEQQRDDDFSVINRADDALYQSKSNGRNQSTVL